MSKHNQFLKPVRQLRTFYVYRKHGVDFQLMHGFDVLNRDGKSRRVKNDTLLNYAKLHKNPVDLGDEFAAQYLPNEHEFFWVKDFIIDWATRDERAQMLEYQDMLTDYQVLPRNPVDSTDTAEKPRVNLDKPIVSRAGPIDPELLLNKSYNIRIPEGAKFLKLSLSWVATNLSGVTLDWTPPKDGGK